MNTSSLISIITPSYKTKGGLKKSIESVLKQTYSNFELIVVDDNNPDTDERKFTEELMSQYQDDHRIIYIKHEMNKNGAAARNTGFRAATGEYIAYLDDDDEFMPEKLEKELRFLQENIEYDAVYSRFFINGAINKALPFKGNCLVEVLSDKTRMQTSTLMFRRRAIETIGGFDESFRRHQDYELLVKFFSHGYKIGYIREPLAIYTTTGQNFVNGKKLEDLKAQFLLKFENVLDKLDEEKKGTKRKIIACNYAYVFICHIASHKFLRALCLLVKYGLTCPNGFFSYIKFFIEYHKKSN